MKGNAVKRYIYASLGALALTGAGFAAAITLTPPSDVATAVIEANASPSASASASPTATKSPIATTSPSESPKPAETPTETPEPPVGEEAAQRDPNDTSPIGVNDHRFDAQAIPEQVTVSPQQEVKTRADGSTYFVNAKTGEEIKNTTTTNGPAQPVQDPYARPLDASGAGSKEDKTNVANSFVSYLNAIYNKDYKEACKYVSVEGLTAADCAAKLEKRTSASPLKSAYTVNNVDPIDVQGDTARVSPLAVKNAAGEGTASMIAHRSPASSSVWLIEDKSLLEVK